MAHGPLNVVDEQNPTNTVIAPDGFDLRELSTGKNGSMWSATLPLNTRTKSVYHQTVEEIWYIRSGTGMLCTMPSKHWSNNKKSNTKNTNYNYLKQFMDCVKLKPGITFRIPPQTIFQNKSDKNSELDVIAITMPPWPGMDEAVPVDIDFFQK